MSLSLRHRSTVAAIGTLLALALTSLGRSPVAGPVEAWAFIAWMLGIAAGLVAFVAAASVFSDVAQRAEDPSPADFRADHGASGHPN